MIRKILGVDLNFGTYEQLLSVLLNNRVKTVTCVNQYYLYMSLNDVKLKNRINSFDLVHPDGIGVFLAQIFLYGYKKNIQKITGTDLYFKIFQLLSSEKKNIFLFGDKIEILLNAKAKIEKYYPNIKIVGIESGYQDLENYSIIEKINNSNAEHLFVGLGAPRQEKWINDWKDKLNVNKIIAVGGAFRVIAGDRKRGPKLVQNLGLEWITRLVTEPQKVWKRYLIGIPVFLFQVFKQRIFNQNE